MTEYLPDPIELMEQRQEASIDRVVVVDGVESYPCDNCGKFVLLDDLICMDPLGVSGGICGDCLNSTIGIGK